MTHVGFRYCTKEYLTLLQSNGFIAYSFREYIKMPVA